MAVEFIVPYIKSISFWSSFVAVPLFLVSILLIVFCHLFGKNNHRATWKHWLLVLLAQMTLSPLAYKWLAKWEMVQKRVSRAIILAFSPLVVYLFIYLLAFFSHMDAQSNYRYTKAETIENLSGCKLPEFKRTSLKMMPRDFHGDFMDEFTLELIEIPDSSFQYQLDSLCEATKDTPNSQWLYADGQFRFHFETNHHLTLDLVFSTDMVTIHGKVVQQ